MPTNSAEYMREYRKRRKAERTSDSAPSDDFHAVAKIAADLIDENARLTEEVARLKRLLAERPEPVVVRFDSVMPDMLRQPDPSFVQFRPAPKPSQVKPHRSTSDPR